MRWWRRFRLWLNPPPSFDTGEMCRECIRLWFTEDVDAPAVPLDTLAADDCWEWGQELPNEPEMGTTGGSWVSGYWCTTHKPEGAWPWAP